MKTFDELRERALTPAEKKKREDVAQAIERDNPKMPMAKKMAIATATAKKSVDEKHKVRCPECNGRGCDHCDNTGYHMKESADLDKEFSKLSNQAQTHANAEMRKGASSKDAIARAKKHYNESTNLEEATAFSVSIEGLPKMFMYGSGPGQILAKLRKIVKQPSMITDVERVTKMDVKKSFRLKAQGRGEEEMDEATQHDPKHVKQAIGIASDPRYKKGNMTGASKAIDKLSPGLSDHPQVKAVLRRQNEANNKTGADWEKSFTKKLKYSTSDNPKVKSYLAKKQDQRTARNKAMDPGAAKKGLAISVIDRDKAYAKGKKKGIGVMDIDTRPGKDHKTGKSNYGKKLPESVTMEDMTPQQKADRLALIKKVVNKRNAQNAARARQDAMRGIKKDKYLTRDMPKEVDEAPSHQDIIARATARLADAERNNNQDAARKHRATISKHQLAMAKEN